MRRKINFKIEFDGEDLGKMEYESCIRSTGLINQ